MEGEHIPVLLHEFLEHTYLPGVKNPTLWDGTSGGAGHIIAWLQKNHNGFAFGSDRDREMLSLAEKKIDAEGLGSRSGFRYGEFSENPWSEKAPFDLVFLDLGISSLHLDTMERGISYRENSPLDMRLDLSKGVPLSEWLTDADEKEIRDVIYRYGEERLAPKIARLICHERKTEQLTTGWLRDVCDRAYGAQRHKVKTPYSRTFQAFRIQVNRELENLERALEFAPSLLKRGGRLVIISFHSLEDRMVKQKFRSLEMIPDHSPEARSNYVQGDYAARPRKAIRASESEVEKNPRSRSAMMRVLERIN